MPKQQTTKKRTQVKTLPKKGKKLSKGDMKKVMGGMREGGVNDTTFKSPKPATDGTGVVSLGKLG